MKRPKRTGRPPLPKGERRVLVAFRLRPETVKLIARLAANGGITRTEVIETLLDGSNVLVSDEYLDWLHEQAGIERTGK